MADIKIDGEIGGWGVSSYEIQRQLDRLNGNIEVEINSPGGSVFEGISIYNAFMEYRKTKGQITFVIKGLAASMGSYIPLAGNKIKVYDNAVYMIHNARLDTYSADAPKLRRLANIVEGLSNFLKNAYVSKTKKTEKEIQSKMDAETYFFGNEIVEYGFADEIIKTNLESDKQSIMSNAKHSFFACMENVKENSKDENLEDIAAILNTDNSFSNQSEENQTENNTNENNLCYNSKVTNSSKEQKKMTKDEFKASHPDLYAQIFSDGENQEKNRVLAHIEMSKTTGASAYAMECIEKGETFNPLVQAKYLGFTMNKNDLNARQDENVPPVETPHASEDVEDKKRDEAFEAVFNVKV